jgi:hypothetical protein
MKGKSKSVKIASLFAAALLISLAACDDFETPHIRNASDIPPEVLAEPRIVPQATETDIETWPRLGDVPDKPKNFSSSRQINKTIQQLKQDRAEAWDAQSQAVSGYPATNSSSPPLTAPVFPNR